MFGVLHFIVSDEGKMRLAFQMSVAGDTNIVTTLEDAADVCRIKNTH